MILESNVSKNLQDIQGETALIKGKILKFLLQYIIKIFLKKLQNWETKK
jgi:hypothetical protein